MVCTPNASSDISGLSQWVSRTREASLHEAYADGVVDWMGDPDSRRMGLPKSVWDGWSIVLGGHMANSQPILTKTEIFIMLSERSGLPRILQSEAC